MEKETYCSILSKHLTEFLGVKVTFNQVLDELFLLENGLKPKNKLINTWIRKTATKTE